MLDTNKKPPPFQVGVKQNKRKDTLIQNDFRIFKFEDWYV
jgi:hypothetical protein